MAVVSCGVVLRKQTWAGQRTRFKAFVVVGDGNGHVGLGVKCLKEVAIAIRGAIILAKLSVVPVRRGYWGNKIGNVHTVLTKVTGKCGSVTVRLVSAPCGARIVAARVPKKVLQFAGIADVFTSSRGSAKTLGNFVKYTRSITRSEYMYDSLMNRKRYLIGFAFTAGTQLDSVYCNRVRATAVTETRWQPATGTASPFVLQFSDKGAIVNIGSHAAIKVYVISFRGGVCMLRIMFISGGCNISKT
ncbi:40S ribosomal protein S2-2 isoform X2 [Helianthus annuus]|uniref:40S ribosomal protein S2-2 isoform X2 n=1 Tax=Helianthus annuus TaxID=4232 RepID=UPI001652E120|nr:40S ribosomal protein S2-2 isoform X2 [Helianthus annuus]